MALEKNLANCTPIEFLKQTNRIRKSAEKWLKATDIIAIRKDLPKFSAPKDADEETFKKLLVKHNEKVAKKAKENLKKILDVVLEDHPEETLELLALACFVEPENVNDHKVTEYLENALAILNDKVVIDFFTSLMRLEQTDI